VSAPTGYPELNSLLADLVAGAQSVLSANFCGAYLQGSFALGSADEHSDVDFVVVTEGEVTEGELEGLQELHRRLHSQDVAWARHLEGSYVPRELLRHVDPERRPLLFLDNGAERLVRDSHCNTAVVRWVLRTHGITLDGPPPEELIAPVAPEDLRREGARALADYADWAREAGGMSEWKQTYLVLTLCRILCMLDTGEVVSKRRGAEWALRSLDGRWHGLVEQALADRPDPWQRVHRAADPDRAEATAAFADYVTSAGTASTA
jgi:predicted nucleotidyltransferase